MRKYLVSGLIQFKSLGKWEPLQKVVTLADELVFDENLLRSLEDEFLQQSCRGASMPPDSVTVQHFQLFEQRPPVLPRESQASRDVVDRVRDMRRRPHGAGFRTLREGLTAPSSFSDMLQAYREGPGADVRKCWAAVAEDIQLNTCDRIMPPVDSPLLIEVAPGVLLKASRLTHAERRDDLLVFELGDGFQYTGRPRWTHP